jgi:hypothetical protein
MVLFLLAQKKEEKNQLAEDECVMVSSVCED